MAFILYKNVIRTGTASGVGSVSGSLSAMIDGRTGTTEGFATGATREFTIDNGSAINVNCLCFARHNFSTVSATVTVKGSSDDVSYSTLFSLTPTSDNVQCKLDSTTHSYRYYKIEISGHDNTATVADMALGETLDLERDQKHGFISPFYADEDKVIANTTIGQNLVGISIKEGLKKVKFRMPYYTSSFFTDWEEFIDSMKKYPIYLVWKQDNTSECFYCWPWGRMPKPRYSKGVSGYSYLDFELDLEGITY